jgi:hypothetical protein
MSSISHPAMCPNSSQFRLASNRWLLEDSGDIFSITVLFVEKILQNKFPPGLKEYLIIFPVDMVVTYLIS